MEKLKAKRLKSKEIMIVNMMIQKHQSPEEEMPTKGIAIDASCIGNPGRASIKGVDLETGEIIFEETIPGKTTSNIAEYIAINRGLKWCLENKRKPILYSDSLVAIGWAKNKKCNSNQQTDEHRLMIIKADRFFNENKGTFYWWNNKKWGETPADFGRKRERPIKN